MVYFALRNQRWETARLTIIDEVITQTENTFEVHYQWYTDDLGMEMTGRVTIIGEPQGSISFDFYGKVLNQFARNRIGICVLHPLDGVAGQPCQVESPAGERIDGYFPDYIAPYQPYVAIQTLRWQPASAQTLRLDFEGDIFEMEDQRNWTDASFKTYCTPLSRPFPVLVQPGDTIAQRVVFSLENTNFLPTNEAATLPLQPADTPTPLSTTKPRIGLGQRADGLPLSPDEAARLRELPLHHLRADVLLTTPGWQLRLRNALADAQALGVALELALFFGADPAADLRQLLAVMDSTTVGVSSVLVFQADKLCSSDVLLRRVVIPLRLAWPTALIGGGTDGSFVDVNRNPFDYSLVDFVVYSITPQVHAFDDLTLLENIAGQTATVQTAHHLTGGKPVHISPVTLLPRYPPIAESLTQRLTPPADARQSIDFGADWTRQSQMTLTIAGVSSITYYETHGPRGLLNGDAIFPVFEAMK